MTVRLAWVDARGHEVEISRLADGHIIARIRVEGRWHPVKSAQGIATLFWERMGPAPETGKGDHDHGCRKRVPRRG